MRLDRLHARAESARRSTRALKLSWQHLAWASPPKIDFRAREMGQIFLVATAGGTEDAVHAGHQAANIPVIMSTGIPPTR
jgi:hypothetical protein